MLPYTAQMTGRVDHVIPAALLVWAIYFYRQPLTAGIFIGLAAGVVYYPLFLLPLWVSFYWQRGLMRFSIGVLSMLLSGVFLAYMVIDKLLHPQIEYPLFKWLTVVLLGFVGAQFIFLWILGEYIGRIYNDVRKRPLYVVAEEINL